MGIIQNMRKENNIKFRGDNNGLLVNGDDNKIYICTNFINNSEALTNFFSLFKQGGIADDCVDYLGIKYELELDECMTPEWRESYIQSLLKCIKEKEHLLEVNFDDIFRDIRMNINKYNNTKDKYNYILSLFQQFSSIICKFINLYLPTGEIKRIENMIEEMKNKKLDWVNSNETDEEKKRNITSANSMINRFEKYKRDCYKLYNKYFTEFNTIKQTKSQKDDVVHIYRHLQQLLKEYANRLDLLLLQNRIDMIKFQESIGIYIKQYRTNSDFIDYGINENITKMYIKEASEIEFKTNL